MKARPRRSRFRSVWRVLQLAAVVVPLTFVSVRLADGWPTASAAIRDASILDLVVACIAAPVSMMGVAWAWGRVLTVFRSPLPRLQLYATYFVGEIGKYVPGWIWAPVGRAELLRRSGAQRVVAYGSVITSLALFVGVGIAATAVLSPVVLSDRLIILVPALAIGLVLAGLLAQVRLRALVVRLVARIVAPDVADMIPTGRTAIGLAVANLPAWLLIATTMAASGHALDADASLTRLAIAGIAGWTAGLLSPIGAGLGAREAVFATASGLDPATGAAAAILARLIFVVTDAAGALVMLPVVARYRSGDRGDGQAITIGSPDDAP